MQEINVILEIPDKEYAAKEMSKAIAEIIKGRLDKLPLKDRLKGYEILIAQLKEQQKNNS
ncbi:hypothetical protein [Dethiothermospora halolimnae]|uniref:hypothetical protein n=1 Tax=Dethiothermospora halolimnae TaxID=3114390 RepID=UPI003CCB9A4A